MSHDVYSAGVVDRLVRELRAEMAETTSSMIGMMFGLMIADEAISKDGAVKLLRQAAKAAETKTARAIFTTAADGLGRPGVFGLELVNNDGE